MYFIQEIKGRDGSTQITHRIKFEGLLKHLFWWFIGKNMVKNIPTTMENMIKRAEEKS